MKRCWLALLLAALALGACQAGPTPAAATPTAALATISAQLPTSVAALHLPVASVPPPSSTPFPNGPYPAPTVAFQPSVTPVPFTPLPPAPIIGRHVVQPGDTIFCIGRAYGVLPAAIAQANGLSSTFSVSTGQVLQIPAVQWTAIPDGPLCAAQFQSPFPGLAGPTATSADRPTPAEPPLVISLNWNCIGNCGSKDGTYLVHVVVTVSGGVAPYTYNPAQTYDVSVPHCTNGQGNVMVTSADGQTTQQAWVYSDVACSPSGSGH